VTEPTGPDTLTVLRLAGHEVTARLAADASYQAGEHANFTLDLGKLVLFDSKTERRIF
jgi:multiple sugar transport system ATP-binding protein